MSSCSTLSTADAAAVHANSSCACQLSTIDMTPSDGNETNGEHRPI